MEIQLAQLTQEPCQLVLAVQVCAVPGDVLRDDDELLHPGGGKLRRLVQQLVHGAAAVLTPQGRNHTIGAVVIAALGDSQIGIPCRRGQNPLAALVGGMDVPQMAGLCALFHHFRNSADNIAIAAGTEQTVHLRQLVENIALIALGHAAGDKNLLDFSLLFQLRHL